MKKIFFPIISFLFPYAALAQVSANDNFNCARGCPFGSGKGGYWGGMMGGVGNMMGWGGSSFAGWSGILLMFLFWILVIAGAVYLVKYIFTQSSKGAGANIPMGGGKMDDEEDEAIILLRKRFAKGDIDKAEFEEKMKYLRKL